MFLYTPPTMAFSKLDRNVLYLPMSEGAKILYWFYATLKPGKYYSDTYAMKAIGISKSALMRRKNELREVDLLHVEQVAARTYITFLGTTKHSASKEFAEWKRDTGGKINADNREG